MAKSKRPRVLIVQTLPRLLDEDTNYRQQLKETGQLVSTFGGRVVNLVSQRIKRIHPEYYIGSGKVGQIKELCEADEIDIVILDAIAKSGQLFRIEKELWEVNPEIEVWDRVDLILHIFDQHASTAEAKLQIRLARATHQGPRMYGLGKTKLSRQGGGVGTRGKGETNIEFERRQIKKEQQKISEQLKKIQTQKQNRIQRRNDRGIGPVALVGYTSAGKTTLFNELTGKEKDELRKLFTTLDTVVGKMKSSYFSQPVLVSDTIGFIQNLPPVLVDSFKSTLLESLEAELILHVVDAGDQHLLQKMAVVDEILDSLDAQQPKILVLNKSDLLTDEEVTTIESKIRAYLSQRLESKREESPEATDEYTAIHFVSAKTGEGVGELKQVIEGFFGEPTATSPSQN